MVNSTDAGAPSAMDTRQDLEELMKNLDELFLIVMGMIVFLMQCGFALLEAGAVRSKNSTNILIKNLLDSSVAGIAYWIFGYAFAFGKGNSFIGWTHWSSHQLPDHAFADFFFQYVFAATAATIVSGAMAERCEFIAYLVYSFVITGFLYPVVTHWVWSENGWLTAGNEYLLNNVTVSVGYKDFAGSGVVHVVGGVASFVGALLLGPRRGRFHPVSRAPAEIRGHSVPLAAMGGFILLFGFLAFNGGSQASISKAGDGASMSLAVVNTIISGSFSAFTTLLINKFWCFGDSKWSLLRTLNGALAGMVAACAGCNVIYPWGAAVVGFISAFSFRLWAYLIVRMRIDDPLDAVGVHWGGGIWGVIAVAFLDREDGILFNWNQKSGLLLAWQLVGLVSITAWTATLSTIMFGVLKVLGLLRVSEELETKGLDIPKHGEPAYPQESYGHGWIETIIRVLENSDTPSISQAIRAAGLMGSNLLMDGRALAHPPFTHHKVRDEGGFEHPEVQAMAGREARHRRSGRHSHDDGHSAPSHGHGHSDGHSDPGHAHLTPGHAHLTPGHAHSSHAHSSPGHAHSGHDPDHLTPGHAHSSHAHSTPGQAHSTPGPSTPRLAGSSSSSGRQGAPQRNGSLGGYDAPYTIRDETVTTKM